MISPPRCAVASPHAGSAGRAAAVHGPARSRAGRAAGTPSLSSSTPRRDDDDGRSCGGPPRARAHATPTAYRYTLYTTPTARGAAFYLAVSPGVVSV